MTFMFILFAIKLLLYVNDTRKLCSSTLYQNEVEYSYSNVHCAIHVYLLACVLSLFVRLKCVLLHITKLNTRCTLNTIATRISLRSNGIQKYKPHCTANIKVPKTLFQVALTLLPPKAQIQTKSIVCVCVHAFHFKSKSKETVHNSCCSCMQ